MFHDAPTEQHRVQFRFRRPPLGHDLRLHLPIDICVLNQHPAADRAQISRRSCFFRWRQQSNQPEVFFLLQDGARLDLKIRCNDYFTENFADHFRQQLGQRTVAYDYSAKGRLFVGCIRLVPSLAKISVRSNSAGIGMF